MRSSQGRLSQGRLRLPTPYVAMWQSLANSHQEEHHETVSHLARHAGRRGGVDREPCRGGTRGAAGGQIRRRSRGRGFRQGLQRRRRQGPCCEVDRRGRIRQRRRADFPRPRCAGQGLRRVLRQEQAQRLGRGNRDRAVPLQGHRRGGRALQAAQGEEPRTGRKQVLVPVRAKTASGSSPSLANNPATASRSATSTGSSARGSTRRTASK